MSLYFIYNCLIRFVFLFDSPSEMYRLTRANMTSPMLFPNIGTAPFFKVNTHIRTPRHILTHKVHIITSCPPCAGDGVRAGAFPGKVSGVHLRVQQHPRVRPGQDPLHPSGEWSVSHTACTPARLCGQLTGSVCVCEQEMMREDAVSRLPLKCVTSVVTLSYVQQEGGGGVFKLQILVSDRKLKKFFFYSLQGPTRSFYRNKKYSYCRFSHCTAIYVKVSPLC